MALLLGLALVFDMDGVIVDSMPVHTEAWRCYLGGLGLECDDIELRMHGRRNDEIVLDFIGGNLTLEEIHRHGALKEELYRTMIRAELEARLVPGVREFVEAHAGFPMAVATNAEPANVDFVLDGANFRRHFKVIVHGMQVKHPKPHPEVYLRAADELGIRPENCIVFEDSPAGVEAARRAGARVVGVQTHAPLQDVDFRIPDFSSRELERWLSEQRPL
jgi:beta-phosphoglucomutase